MSFRWRMNNILHDMRTCFQIMLSRLSCLLSNSKTKNKTVTRFIILEPSSAAFKQGSHSFLDISHTKPISKTKFKKIENKNARRKVNLETEETLIKIANCIREVANY